MTATGARAGHPRRHDEVAIPKLLHSGSYFPDWLLERRRRASRPVCELPGRLRGPHAPVVPARAAVPPFSGRGSGADRLVRAMVFGYSDQEDPPGPARAGLPAAHHDHRDSSTTRPVSSRSGRFAGRELRRCTRPVLSASGRHGGRSPAVLSGTSSQVGARATPRTHQWAGRLPARSVGGWRVLQDQDGGRRCRLVRRSPSAR